MQRFAIVFTLFLTGCASAPPPAPEVPTESQNLLDQKEMSHQRLSQSIVSELLPVADSSSGGDSARVISSSAALRLETGNPDSVHARTIAYAYDHNGFVLQSDKEQTVIRIPAREFHGALSELELLGKLIEKKISTDDVTNQFFDLQTRLANALKTRERYLDLLLRANSISEVLRVEQELERINRQIETYKGQLSRLGHLTLLSTVSVSTRQKSKPGPISRVFAAAVRGVGWLF
jgi:hypothetical protein